MLAWRWSDIFFLSAEKNPAGADDDQTASMYKKSTSKRGFLGLFSPSKKNIVTDPEPIPEKDEAPTPKAEAPPTPDPKSNEAGPASPGSPENEQAVTEVASKDIAYEQDNSVVDSPQDCWGLGSNCSVM